MSFDWNLLPVYVPYNPPLLPYELVHHHTHQYPTRYLSHHSTHTSDHNLMVVTNRARAPLAIPVDSLVTAAVPTDSPYTLPEHPDHIPQNPSTHFPPPTNLSIPTTLLQSFYIFNPLERDLEELSRSLTIESMQQIFHVFHGQAPIPFPFDLFMQILTFKAIICVLSGTDNLNTYDIIHVIHLLNNKQDPNAAYRLLQRLFPNTSLHRLPEIISAYNTMAHVVIFGAKFLHACHEAKDLLLQYHLEPSTANFVGGHDEPSVQSFLVETMRLYPPSKILRLPQALILTHPRPGYPPFQVESICIDKLCRDEDIWGGRPGKFDETRYSFGRFTRQQEDVLRLVGLRDDRAQLGLQVAGLVIACFVSKLGEELVVEEGDGIEGWRIAMI